MKNKYLSISFFLNVSESKSYGNSIIALVRERENIEQARADMESEDFIITSRENDLISSYSFTVYRNGTFFESFDVDDFVDGKVTIHSAPIRSDFWDMDEDYQIKAMDRLKNSIIGKTIAYPILPMCDMNRLHILFQEYCHKEDQKMRRFFAPISGSIILELF